MLVVNAGLGGVLPQAVHHVADVVQQRRGDQRRRGTRLLGEQRGLQRVLQLVYIMQSVATLALVRDERHQPRD